jgi:hypothetical protein
MIYHCSIRGFDSSVDGKIEVLLVFLRLINWLGVTDVFEAAHCRHIQGELPDPEEGCSTHIRKLVLWTRRKAPQNFDIQ